MPNPIIDIIKTTGNDRPRFTVDTTGPTEVALVASVSALGTLKTKAGNSLFQPKDGAIILGIGIILPYCFGISSEPVSVTLGQYVDGALVNATVINSFFIPFTGQEMSMAGAGSNGLYVPFPNTNPVSPYCNLDAQIGQGKISMVNVPAAFNTQVLFAEIFLRVQHLIPLGH